MTIREKLARETGREIYLYKQGVFWIAYEQSALLLGLEKELRPSFRFIKAVDREVLSVGFPESTRFFFCDIFGSFIETGKNTGYFKLNGQYDAIDFDARRKQILEENVEKSHSQNKKEVLLENRSEKEFFKYGYLKNVRQKSMRFCLYKQYC